MATLAKEHLKRFSNLDLNQTHYQHYGALEFYSYLKHVKTLQLFMHLLLPVAQAVEHRAFILEARVRTQKPDQHSGS